ncbi:MAG: VWA domain-containing protein [Actinobacteria bacterium]|nr:VWA domain-containing protein [Actinomycetota bacterium]
MLPVLASFVEELRRSGLPVSLTEHLDAAAALGQVPLDDREVFKGALAATLVKDSSHLPVFDTVFDVWFSLAGVEDHDAAVDQDDDASLAELLERALAEGGDELLQELARRAVRRHAGLERGGRMGLSYHHYRTLRHLDLEGTVGRLVEQAGSRAGGEWEPLQERLHREELERRGERLRREIDAELRRRLVADRGAAEVARALRRPLPEDVDFMHATRDELAQLRRSLQPLARRLAVRLARKRRHRRGALDFRATVRRSLGSGGVPAEPRFRHRRPAKPEIFVVADISGSVAAFARFTLALVHAISSQFSRVRSFVFIDGLDEVTRFFSGEDEVDVAIRRVNTEADVVWAEGHSDYGMALEAFWDRFGDEVSGRSTVLVLGDARTNYHEPRSWVLRELGHRARHLYWLNPEPSAYWDSGDSVMSDYGIHCDGVYECRNLRQLERFVERLAA